MKLIIRSNWLALILLISACNSHIPPEISKPLDGAPSVAQVRDQTETYLSQRVRWGGVILHTENKQNASWMTIVAFPLSDRGEPQSFDQTSGRFIAIVDKFLEPLVYGPDREITVTGKVIRTETLNVGEYPYEHPVIQVDHYYLWPQRLEPADYAYPPYWLYDPYYPWPYHPHKHRRIVP